MRACESSHLGIFLGHYFSNLYILFLDSFEKCIIIPLWTGRAIWWVIKLMFCLGRRLFTITLQPDISAHSHKLKCIKTHKVPQFLDLRILWFNWYLIPFSIREYVHLKFWISRTQRFASSQMSPLLYLLPRCFCISVFYEWYHPSPSLKEWNIAWTTVQFQEPIMFYQETFFLIWF